MCWRCASAARACAGVVMAVCRDRCCSCWCGVAAVRVASGVGGVFVMYLAMACDMCFACGVCVRFVRSACRASMVGVCVCVECIEAEYGKYGVGVGSMKMANDRFNDHFS